MIMNRFGAVTIALLNASAFLLAQTYTAAIRGVVTDATQASVSGAQVFANNTSRSIQQSATRNSSGRYVLANLPPGDYTLTVEAPGFKKYVRSAFAVQVNQDVSINVVMQVGKVTESVSVSGEAPLLESSTSSVGKVVENREIVNLPLNRRDRRRVAFRKHLLQMIHTARLGHDARRWLQRRNPASGSPTLHRSPSAPACDGVPAHPQRPRGEIFLQPTIREPASSRDCLLTLLGRTLPGPVTLPQPPCPKSGLRVKAERCANDR